MLRRNFLKLFGLAPVGAAVAVVAGALPRRADRAIGYSSYAIGRREDLSDFVYSIAPTETPFLNQASLRSQVNDYARQVMADVSRVYGPFSA